MKFDIRKFNGPRDWGWIQERNPIHRVEDTCGFVAFLDGVHAAAAIFDNFTHESVNFHLVIDRPIVLRHGFMETAIEFARDTARKNLVLMRIDVDNHKALQIAKRYGAEEIFRLGESVFMALRLNQAATVADKGKAA